MEFTKSSVTYAHPKLKVDDYWNRGITGKGVKVGIVDDMMGLHDALPIAGGIACGRFTQYHATNYTQGSNHATHCAGIIGGRNLVNGQPTGVAPDVEIYAIRMDNTRDEDRVYTIIELIDYAIDEGLDIVTMSIHISENSSNISDGRFSSRGTPKHLRIKMRDAFIKAWRHGLIIVVAAGNHNDGRGEDNIEFEELLPKMPNVITVANLTPIDTRRDSSGVGRWVDIAGYGTHIKSTTRGGGYGRLTGTSMSTPQIAGVIALYKQLFNDLSPQEIVEKVFDNCVMIPGLNSEQQGRGVPMPPPELYDLPTLNEAENQFRRYTDYSWQATEAYTKIDGDWIEMEAIGGYGE